MDNLINKIEDVPRDRTLVVFDLDGTLAESKADIDEETAGLLKKLLENRQVAVIGGGKYQLFQRQLISKLRIHRELLEKLYLFPTTSTSFYKYEGGDWKQVYAYQLSDSQKKEIFDTFEKVFKELNYSNSEKIYGQVLEDRGTQVTFSALGQEAPIGLKNEWREKNDSLRMEMVRIIQRYLPDMEVRAGGQTSIDVTVKGIDKQYGMEQIKKQLGIEFKDMLFVGDALFKGGNDEAVRRTGVDCFEVKTPEDTKKVIRHILQLD